MSVKTRNRRRGNSGKQGPKTSATPTTNTKSSEVSEDKSESEAGSSESNNEISKKPSTNDPAWYMTNPELSESVGHIPFSEAQGDVIQIADYTSVTEIQSGDNNIWRLYANTATSLPGIMSVKIRPTFGHSTRITDALNQAATEFYTLVRYANNGRKNYEPSDLMINTLCISELYALIMWMEKIYGSAFIYSNRNKFLGKVMLQSYGINPDDIINNLANLRYFINVCINRVSAYAVPNAFALFSRRAFIYAGTYIENDAGNIKDQIYTFVPDGFFKFELDAKGRGACIYHKLHTLAGVDPATQPLLTFANLQTIFNSLMDNINQDEDFGLMSGDILKAFGTEGLIGIPPLDESYIVAPIYDSNVLDQIHNANIIPDSAIRGAYRCKNALVETSDWEDFDYAFGNVYQDDAGVLKFILGKPGKGVVDLDDFITWTRKPTLDIYDSGASTEFVMEATRLSATRGPANMRNSKVAGYVDGQYVPDYEFLTCGSDVVTGMKIYYFNNDGIHALEIKGAGANLSDDYVVGPHTLKELSLYTNFKYAPILMGYKHDENASETGIVAFDLDGLIGQVSNLTIISSEQIDRINTVALLSLVNVNTRRRAES